MKRKNARKLLDAPSDGGRGSRSASFHPRWYSSHWYFQEPLHYRLYRYPLIWAAAAIILGGKTGGLVTAVTPFSWIGACCVCAILWLAAIWRQSTRVSVVAALTGIFFFGAAYGARAIPPTSDDLSSVASRKSLPIIARARITQAAVWMPNPNYRPGEPDSSPWRTRWEVALESVKDGGDWSAVGAQSRLLIDGRCERFLPGDLVEVHGSFRRICPPTNPGVFDVAGHHRRHHRFVLLTADTESQVSLLESNWSHPVARMRAVAVRQVDRTLREFVAFGQSSLAAALVFGQREQVDWQDQQQLMATGTLHMLAISGMHVEMVALAVLLVCALLRTSDRTRLISVIAICGLYAGLAGGKPPVLRAVILVGAFEAARCLGRKPRLVNLLGLAAIALFLLHVGNMDNVGVHLSFLAVATIGIFVVNRPGHEQDKPDGDEQLQKLLQESRGTLLRLLDMGRRWTVSMLSLSFWVWLITCPLVWTHFHVVAPIAILINVIIALPLGLSLLAGILTGVLGWISPLGWCGGMVCGAGLALIGEIIEIGKQIPAGHVWLPAPPTWWTISFYCLAVGWLILFGRSRLRVLALILTAWVAIGIAMHAWGPRGFAASWQPSHAGGLVDQENASAVFSFLDVGHGTCVIIELPNEEVWLYDAGHLGSGIRSHEEIAATLWDLGTARIDTLIISHADADHYNAVLGLADRFAIGRVVSTPQFWQSNDRDVRHLLAELKDRGVQTETWSAGSTRSVPAHATDRIADIVQIHVLHPQEGFRAASDNASSLCLLFEYLGKRVLLPGDLEGHGLLNLVELPARPCHVLMAPHHGSLSVDPRDLLNWCQPELIVISGNHRANREAVRQMYSIPGAQVGITFRDGAVRYVIDAGGGAAQHWDVDHWRELR